MKKYLFLVLLLCGGGWQLAAQAPKVQLRLLGAAIGDSVVLRWAVANQEAFPRANVAGYLLERTVLNEKNEVVGRSRQRVTRDTIRPWPYPTLDRRVSRTDTFALLAAQCLYGKSVVPENAEKDLIAALKIADEEAEARYGFSLLAADLSAQAANLLGWRWVDRDVRKGYKYLYWLYCPERKGQAVSDTAFYLVKPDDYRPLQAPEAPVLQSGEKHVSLTWRKQAQFTAFYPERSSDGVHFQRLTDRPYLEWVSPDRPQQDSLTYVDSVENYRLYHYRLVGINPFAQQSPPSAAVVGMGVDRKPPPAVEVVSGVWSAAGVTLSWENPPPTEPLQGIVIGKAAGPAGPVVPLTRTPLPTGTTTFKDDQPWPYATSFYTVGLVDTAGNIGWSALTYVIHPDEAPPAGPMGLQGSIDTTGRVNLHWNLGPDNDLKGYQVFAANQADHQFIPLSDSLLTDTLFRYQIDLGNLTEHIFYRVKAYDLSLKESAFSDILALTKPDRVAPDAPVLDDYQVVSNGVYLHWRTASAKDLDGQRLLRRAPGKPWEVLANLPKDAAAFTDTTLRSGAIQEYAVQSVDDAGLRSEPSFPVVVKLPPVAKKQSVTRLRARWDEQEKQVVVEWELAPPVCTRVLIYRSYNDGGLEMLSSAPAERVRFADTKAQRPGQYTYALRPLFADGAQGPLTEIVTIQKL